MNAHDSERIKGMLEELGLGEAATQEEADVIVFNTCTIREKPDTRFAAHVGNAVAHRRPKAIGADDAGGGDDVLPGLPADADEIAAGLRDEIAHGRPEAERDSRRRRHGREQDLLQVGAMDDAIGEAVALAEALGWDRHDQFTAHRIEIV